MKLIQRLDEIRGIQSSDPKFKVWVAKALAEDGPYIAFWFRTEGVFIQVMEAIANGRIPGETVQAFRKAFDRSGSQPEFTEFLERITLLRSLPLTAEELETRTFQAAERFISARQAVGDDITNESGGAQ